MTNPRIWLVTLLSIIATALTDINLYAQHLQKGSQYISLKTLREGSNSIFISGDFDRFTNLDYDLRAETGYFYTNRSAVGISVGATMNHAWGNGSRSQWINNKQRRVFADIRAELTSRNYVVLSSRLLLFLRSSVFYDKGLFLTKNSEAVNSNGNPDRTYINTHGYGLTFRPGLAYKLNSHWTIEGYSNSINFEAGKWESPLDRRSSVSLSSSTENPLALNIGVCYSPSMSASRQKNRDIPPLCPENFKWVVGGGFRISNQNTNFVQGGSYQINNLSASTTIRYFLSTDISLNTNTTFRFNSFDFTGNLSNKGHYYYAGVGLEKYFPIWKKLYAGIESSLGYSTDVRHEQHPQRNVTLALSGELVYKLSERWSLNSTIARANLLELNRQKEKDGRIVNYARILGPPNVFSTFSLSLAYWIPER
ncbi:hypothetical protein [Telluribacter sp.]|jgi:hypothetical protein|uniref:hypothetical protein n=1 Tax=Telluribacter sp. TaxID=1978767 RepID=UPI002E10DED0|nr:hypothetical protein [Telluribacter sp.]